MDATTRRTGGNLTKIAAAGTEAARAATRSATDIRLELQQAQTTEAQLTAQMEQHGQQAHALTSKASRLLQIGRPADAARLYRQAADHLDSMADMQAALVDAI